MKTFNIPVTYRSPLITAIKNARRQGDKMKKDLSPTLLDFGKLQIFLARAWMTRFRMGPVEWLWRSLTYFKLQPNTRGASQPA